MARSRKPVQMEAPQRRITAAISDSLMRRVGAYSKYACVPLSELMESALTQYLASKHFGVKAGGEQEGLDAD